LVARATKPDGEIASVATAGRCCGAPQAGSSTTTGMTRVVLAS